ncbi:MAG: LysE family translocator [Verrucomicrobiota bacterium]
MVTAEFLITAFIVVISPGTGVIYTVSTGILLGREASLAAAFGCTLGIMPHLLASVLGLSMILHTSAVAFQILKYIGAAYLLYLAWRTWRDSNLLELDSEAKERKFGGIVKKAVLINVLNPKLSIFFLAFLPPFIDGSSANAHFQMGLLSALFTLMTLGVFIIYGLCASRVRKALVESKTLLAWLQKSFAACFAFVGLKLATERQ